MPNPLFDNLRPASFRAIPFQVSGSEFEGGRRVQLHEYPQRDKPYAQDMGRAARHIDFDAFVVGADYVDQSNRLLGALEQSGAGQLVHPWFGTLTVNLVNYRVAFDRGLGQARFTLSFVESGELTFPSAADSTALLTRQAAGALESASVNRFATAFAVLGQVNYVADAALTAYGKALAFLSNPAFLLTSAIGYGSLLGNLTSLAALFNVPLSLSWNFAGLLDLSGPAKSGALKHGATTAIAGDKALSTVITGLVTMVANPALGAPPIVSGASPSTQQLTANTAAINANARQLLLVQAIGITSYLQCAVYDDIIALRAALAAALDAEALLADDDDLYQALIAARSAMWRDLTERARNSARLLTYTPAEVLPALVLAYDRYEDATRDQEIVDRNRVMHPGFVPASPLWLLSR